MREARPGSGGGAGDSVVADDAALHFQQASDGCSIGLLEFVLLVEAHLLACRQTAHRYCDLGGDVHRLPTGVEPEGAAELQAGVGCRQRQAQIRGSYSLDRHGGVAVECSRSHRDHQPVAIAYGSALAPQQGGAGARHDHLHRNSCLRCFLHSGDHRRTWSFAEDLAIGAHLRRAFVAGEVAGAVVGLRQVFAQAGELDLAPATVRGHGHGLRVNHVETHQVEQLVFKAGEAPGAEGCGRRDLAAPGHQGAIALAHAGETAVGLQPCGRGVGERQVEVGGRQGHARLIGEVADEAQIDAAADADDRPACAEVDRDQGRVAHIHLNHCRCRGGVTVVGHDFEGGRTCEAILRQEGNTAAVAGHPGAAVGGPQDPQAHRIALDVGDEAAQRLRHLQSLVGEEGGCGELGRQIRAVAEIGKQQLQIGGVDVAIEVDVGADQVAGIAGHAAAGGGQQAGVDAIDARVAVDVAGHHQR